MVHLYSPWVYLWKSVSRRIDPFCRLSLAVITFLSYTCHNFPELYLRAMFGRMSLLEKCEDLTFLPLVTSFLTWGKNARNSFDIFWRAIERVFRFSIRQLGAELEGGSLEFRPPGPWWSARSNGPSRVKFTVCCLGVSLLILICSWGFAFAVDSETSTLTV